MIQANFKPILAILALSWAMEVATPSCLAENGAVSRGNGCSNDWSNCSVCRCCDRCSTVCDRVCQFRVVDGCTKCAWHRTWHAPYAPATPLREYYIPRPPQCCWNNGCGASHGEIAGATWEIPADTNCQDRKTLASTDVSPEAAAGFSPAHFERLGKIRNELDVNGLIGGPAPGSANAPAR